MSFGSQSRSGKRRLLGSWKWTEKQKILGKIPYISRGLESSVDLQGSKAVYYFVYLFIVSVAGPFVVGNILIKTLYPWLCYLGYLGRFGVLEFEITHVASNPGLGQSSGL